jgi:hypothetical protein
VDGAPCCGAVGRPAGAEAEHEGKEHAVAGNAERSHKARRGDHRLGGSRC